MNSINIKLMYHLICTAKQIKENCHNPTNNPKQLKKTFVGVVLLSVKKTTTPQFQTTQEADFKYATLSQSNKTKYRRRPQFLNWKMTSIFKWKTTLIFKMEDNFNFLNERRPQFFLMEDDLNFFFNGRQPQFCLIENDLNVSMN